MESAFIVSPSSRASFRVASTSPTTSRTAQLLPRHPRPRRRSLRMTATDPSTNAHTVDASAPSSAQPPSLNYVS